MLIHSAQLETILSKKCFLQKTVQILQKHTCGSMHDEVKVTDLTTPVSCRCRMFVTSSTTGDNIIHKNIYLNELYNQIEFLKALPSQ
jgi:hypothetical protein